MSEYYGVQRSTSLSHYGVKGMKWGVRKKLHDYKMKRANKKFDKRIVKNSRSAQFAGEGGFMSSPSRAKKDSERQKLANEWNREWYNKYYPLEREMTDKETRNMDNKYRDRYVRAVLKDTGYPATRKNVSRAYGVLAKTDQTFARHYKPKKSYR